MNWQAEGSYFLGEFLYLQVSPPVRTKIQLPIAKSSMEVPHSMLSIPSAPQTAGFIPATAALGGIAFPFQSRRGNKYSSCSGWDRGCGIFLSPLSPAGMLATTQVRRGGCLKRIWNLSKMALFHHAVESGRVVVIPPPQSHLPTSLLAQQ